MKVLFTLNVPSPYRMEFNNMLGKLCDLTVVYERAYSRDREKSWHDEKKAVNYKEIF